jgi:hypothetical protein
VNEFEIAVAGRFSALEFILEVLTANHLAFTDPATSAAFKADLVNREGRLRAGLMDASDMQKIAAETQRALENFVDKVTEREAELRSHLTD